MTSVTALGHRVSKQTDRRAVGSATVAEDLDVALVIVGDSFADALATIAAIVRDADCPIIAILNVEDQGFINAAARLGIFAHIVHAEDRLDELQSSIDIALRRFAEYHAPQGAFGRRAVTERAKGILMERHGIDEQEAFNMLRTHARRNQRKLVEIAESVVTSHRLLPGRSSDSPDDAQRPVEPTV